MKVAISTDADHVSPHFGRCPYFTIVEIEEGKILSREIVNNPGHQPAFLPQFLSEKKVSCIIAGGMGRRAEALFSEKGIETLVGISGPVSEVIDKLIKGTLEGGESLCKPGSGRGYGIEKGECDHPEGHHHESS
ncbi:MAG: dinitrogenase iron-molybdenum cofactor [candidate division Zixibacteria bacterium SM1_73]|nr:MAG: dinitrogenase iron-molybdenum cofactor [candidate division Zixibacteria bacterium SM1_73]